ncbi:MAG: M20/M25/M40 family metallo-hydrolase [Bacteroidales bacterium]|nr:M20/M25/M40 family metallo-hydrolase [Bacteroidales bacterium]
MKKTLFTLVLLAAAMATGAAQDKTVQKILETGRTDNQVMNHVDILTNRIGGRVVGSHALEDAEQWAAAQFRSWGLDVQVQEVGTMTVGFNRGPWFGHVVGDTNMPLHFGTPSYTAGTKGVQRGHVVIEPKTRRELEKMKGRLKGAWVLIGGESNGMALDASPRGDSLRTVQKARVDSIETLNQEIRRHNAEHRMLPKALHETNTPPALFYREMVEAGVLGFIQKADLPLKVHYDRANCHNLTWDTLPTVCDIKLDAHQYAMIEQKVKEFADIELEFDIRNHFSPVPVKYHNIIASIKGTKHPDEYVILGGHLDAFDSATGGVDDGHGSAIVMEAARLLATSGAKPERTMLFCLWTGEEYGLYGSKFFVENKTVPLEKISNYINRDGGPLAATGVTVPDAMYDDYVKICAPVMNYDPRMPFTVSRRESPAGPRPKRAGGSDHAYFAMNGVPTIGFQETDPLGYNFSYYEIWHTERDLYNRVIPEYVEYSAVIEAVVAYGIANLKHQLSREGLYSE